MTLEADIVEALRTSHATHQAILAEISSLRTETSRMARRVAELGREIARLEAEAVNVVEPALVQPAINDLMRAVGDMVAALRSIESPAPVPSAAPPDTPVPTPAAPPAEPAPAPDGSEATRQRSSARSWTDPSAPMDQPAPAGPPVISSRPSRFGFRSG